MSLLTIWYTTWNRMQYKETYLLHFIIQWQIILPNRITVILFMPF